MIARDELVAALMFAGREYSTAAVLFHDAVAKRFRLSVTDLKALDILQRRGGLTAGEIAVRTSLATASVTSLIDRLPEEGVGPASTRSGGLSALSSSWTTR